MTDPRMTPMNDAPVTVEQLAQRKVVNTVLAALLRPYINDPVRLIATGNGACTLILDGLAALASAPAVDESRAVALVRRIAAREPWQAHYGRTWEDEAADIVAGLPASAPAGDGGGSFKVVRGMDVPKGAWDWIDRIAVTLDGPHKRIEQPRDAEVIVLWHDERPAAIVLNLRDQFNHSIQYRAALARPRAAVGEREA